MSSSNPSLNATVAGVIIAFLLDREAYATDQCDFNTISQPIAVSGAKDVPFRVVGLEMSFKEDTIVVQSGGFEFRNDVVIPKITIVADVTRQLEAVKQVMRDKVREEAKGIDATNLRFYAPSVRPDAIVLPGAFNAEKWWSMTGFTCTWYGKCRKKEWKTRVFERTVDFTATITRKVRQNSKGVVLPVSSLPLAGTSQQANEFVVTVDADGKTNDDRSELEKVWDFVAGFLESIDRIFRGNNELQLSDFLGLEYSAGEGLLEPQSVLRTRLDNYGYNESDTKNLHFRSFANRDIWESFNAGIEFESHGAAFVRAAAGPQFRLSYDFDYDRYLRALDTSYSGARLPRRIRGSTEEPRTRIDILDRAIFCSYSRESLSKYLVDLAAKFERQDSIKKEVKGSRKEILKEIKSHYSVLGVEEYYRSNLRNRRSTGASNSREPLTLIPESELLSRPALVPGLGSIYALSVEQDWSSQERQCAHREAARRSGSPDLVYPFQSFESCFNDDSDRVSSTLGNRLVQIFGEAVFTPTTRITGPIAGTAQYRGWYYCYLNPSICSGRQRVTWWQAPSKYKARGGMHLGVDLIDGDDEVNEEIKINAVADGRLIYNYLDPRRWGHAIVLPFSHSGRQFMAVYAHLPPSAKQLDGKTVTAGQSLGLAGCSGNAGNGSGACNNYCDVGAFSASDIHLHFELLEKVDKKTTAVDPLVELKFSVKEGNLRRMYVCEGAATRSVVPESPKVP